MTAPGAFRDAAMAAGTEVPLDHPLPAEVGGGWLREVLRYRCWPVFSTRWLLGRLLVFGGVLLTMAALSVLGTVVAGPGLKVGLTAGGWMVLSFLLMAFAGPLLAALVRYRGWPLRRERVGVVLAVLVGMGLASLADRWGSSHIEALIVPAFEANDPAVRQAREQAEARAREPWAVAASVGVGLGIYFVLGGGLALSGYFREQRRWVDAGRQRALAEMDEARQEAERRLALLQAQVEPHFLFNTLASIRALVRLDPGRAEATLDALATHLRGTMTATGDGRPLPDSTLQQQLAIAESYLAVMRLRLGGRLSTRIDADASVLAQPFPPLLLITLVENAVKHGIEPKQGPGEIRIEARRDGVRLVVDVLDDGVGLQPGQGVGMGLANVRAQLTTTFGEAASLEVASRATGGCRVRLVLPWRGESA